MTRTGSGPPLVLVHGWGLHAGIWQGMDTLLGAHHTVLAPDLPGYGARATVSPYTLEKLADAMVAAIAQPAIWLGWSLGGLVALAAAQRHPQAVRKLILVGATPRFVQSADWPGGLTDAVFAQFAADLRDDYRATVQRFLSLQMGAGERDTLRSLRQVLAAAPVPAIDVLAAGLALLQATDLRAQLSALTLPVQIVHGVRDKLAPVAAARFLAQALPQAQLALIEGAGHAPFLSHPMLFRDHVLRFTGNDG